MDLSRGGMSPPAPAVPRAARRAGARALPVNKNLRAISLSLVAKVRTARAATSTAIANELAREAVAEVGVGVSDAELLAVEKNIRRRLYDSLKVLVSVGAISRESTGGAKVLVWNGVGHLLPGASGVGGGATGERRRLRERVRERRGMVAEKRGALRELVGQETCLKALYARNIAAAADDERTAESGGKNGDDKGGDDKGGDDNDSDDKDGGDKDGDGKDGDGKDGDDKDGESKDAGKGAGKDAGKDTSEDAGEEGGKEGGKEDVRQGVDNDPAAVDAPEGLRQPSRIQLPFVLVRTPEETEINLQSTDDARRIFFDFSDYFQVVNDSGILERMFPDAAAACADTVGTANLTAAVVPPQQQQMEPPPLQQMEPPPPHFSLASTPPMARSAHARAAAAAAAIAVADAATAPIRFKPEPRQLPPSPTTPKSEPDLLSPLRTPRSLRAPPAPRRPRGVSKIGGQRHAAAAAAASLACAASGTAADGAKAAAGAAADDTAAMAAVEAAASLHALANSPGFGADSPRTPKRSRRLTRVGGPLPTQRRLFPGARPPRPPGTGVSDVFGSPAASPLTQAELFAAAVGSGDAESPSRTGGGLGLTAIGAGGGGGRRSFAPPPSSSMATAWKSNYNVFNGDTKIEGIDGSPALARPSPRKHAAPVGLDLSAAEDGSDFDFYGIDGNVGGASDLLDLDF